MSRRLPEIRQYGPSMATLADIYSPEHEWGDLRTDALSQAHWETCFEIRFLTERASQFQLFFWEIMERKYPSDFQRVTPWGQVGDLKNDGFLGSKRWLFQCYGPAVMDASEANTKIDSDYVGAVTNWSVHFDEWIFVHNVKDGLPAPVVKKLLDIAMAYPKHPARQWGYADLRAIAMSLGDGDLVALLGHAPTLTTMLTLGVSDLQPLIQAIQGREPKPDDQLEPVPPGKVEANAFSQAVVVLLQNGLIRSPLLSRYFKGSGNARLHDEIGAWFREQYASLKAEGMAPDLIFDRLRRLVGGVGPPDAMRETAVLAIVAYFFALCDIFEPGDAVDASAN